MEVANSCDERSESQKGLGCGMGITTVGGAFAASDHVVSSSLRSSSNLTSLSSFILARISLANLVFLLLCGSCILLLYTSSWTLVGFSFFPALFIKGSSIVEVFVRTTERLGEKEIDCEPSSLVIIFCDGEVVSYIARSKAATS